jgi:hypothetical protein
VLLWGLDSRRFALRARRDGVLGDTARANNTAYTVGQIYTSGTKSFVVVTAGTTTSSAPGGLTSANYGDRITDGTAVVECVATTAQTPDFEAVPFLSAAPVTLAATNATITIDQGPVFECASATADVAITLGSTNAVKGDQLRIRNWFSVAFKWVITHNGGADTLELQANSRNAAVFEFDGTNWQIFSATGTIST